MKNKLQKTSMGVVTVVLFVSVIKCWKMGYWEIATLSSFAQAGGESPVDIQINTISSRWQEVFYLPGGICQTVTHREVYINRIGMGKLNCISGILFKDFTLDDPISVLKIKSAVIVKNQKICSNLFNDSVYLDRLQSVVYLESNEQSVIRRVDGVFICDNSIMLEDLDSIEVKDIIKLGADTTMPLGTIDKVIVTKDRLFVLDKTFSKFLFVYDRQGNFLWKIGYKGRGKGEYLSGPKDFVVDESIKNTDVFEVKSKQYSLIDWNGELIHTKVLENTWPYSFTKSDSIFYFAYNTVDKDSYLLRIEDERRLRFLNINPWMRREIVSDHSFFTAPQNIYFVEDYNNDVFVLKKNGLGIIDR